MLIPKLIHKTFENSAFLLPEYVQDSERISALNPDWTLRFYSSQDREDFIRSRFDSETLRAYLSIDSRYGASRADLFRYLVVYSEGGLYLDLKATAMKPLNTVIRDDDSYVVAHWPNQIDGIDLSQIGEHDELTFLEYQNWFILSTPKHFVLEKVIDQVLKNLRDYRPIMHGVGKSGVLRTTGPIAYSKVVHEFVLNSSARLATNDELGFRPTIHKIESSVYPFPNMHKIKHYSGLHIPLVRKSTLHSILYSLFHRVIFKIKNNIR